MNFRALILLLILICNFFFSSSAIAAKLSLPSGLKSSDYSLSNLTWARLGKFSGSGTMIQSDPSITQQLGYNPSRSWSKGSWVQNVMQVGDIPDAGNIPWTKLIDGDLSKTSIQQGFPIWNNVSIRDFIALNPSLADRSLDSNPLIEAIVSPSEYKTDVRNAILKNAPIINRFVRQNPWAIDIPIGSLLQGDWDGKFDGQIRSVLSQIVKQFPGLANVTINGLIAAANVNPSSNTAKLTPYLVAGPITPPLIAANSQNIGQFTQSNPAAASLPAATQVNTSSVPLSSVPVSSSTQTGSIPGALGQPVSQAGNLSSSSTPSGTNSSTPSAADIFQIGIADFDLADRISGKAAFALTGGTKGNKFKPTNCDGKLGVGGKDGDCSNIEINNSLTLQGLVTQAINPNVDGVVDGMQLVYKKQIVKGGFGILGAVNNGNEPTGWKPWGMKPPVKLVLAKINQAETSADLELYFQICKRGFPDLGCTPHFLGPIPAPPPFSPVKDKGPIIITTVNKPPPLPPQFFGAPGGCSSSSGSPGLPPPSNNPNAPLSQQNLYRYLERIAAGESAGGTNLGPNYLGAYGKYQFIPSTRDIILRTYGYDAWNPAQWDQAAIALIKDVGGQALLDTIASGNFPAADARLNRTWTSLPGGAEQSPLWSNSANLITYGPVNSPSSGVPQSGQGTLTASASNPCGGTPIPCPPGQRCVLLNPNPTGIIPSWGGMYGAPRPGRIHAGVDLQSPKGARNWQRGPGENIKSPADGTVSEHVPVGGRCGGIVAINHPGFNLETRHVHMVQTFVTIGQSVQRGQTIGVEGNETPSGCGSTGAHLHYEIRTGGVTTDPTKIPHDPPLPTAPG